MTEILGDTHMDIIRLGSVKQETKGSIHALNADDSSSVLRTYAQTIAGCNGTDTVQLYDKAFSQPGDPNFSAYVVQCP
jgi:hypothetical protein